MRAKVKCYYEAVTRKFVETKDNNWQYSDRVEIPLTANGMLNVDHDFIHVYCDGKHRIYDDFLTQAHIKSYHAYKGRMNLQSASNSGKKFKRHKIDEKLNILMVGIDSTSRLNSLRQLTELRNYILHELNGFELAGYNRVGDNTFLNVYPLLTGEAFNEYKWSSSRFFDDQPFVWKPFMSQGYATQYVEDDTKGSIFNYLKAGFSKYPTHHYYRHMALALENAALCKNSPELCCGRKGLHRWTLDYVKQFTTTYHSSRIPFFSFLFNTQVSHSDVNGVGQTDADYAQFVRWAHHSNILNNTVLMIFGDHGFRYGGIRSTYVGRYEENMPMMLLALPEWFGRKYPACTRALRSNQNMLTTPFDVQETLRDLCTDCEFNKPSDYGRSLFERVPVNRTCRTAGIPTHYCACREERKLSVGDKEVVKASEALLKRINELGETKGDLCLVQRISRIIDASTTLHSQNYSRACTRTGACYDSLWHKLEQSSTLYLVTIQTSPGVGQFQATVRARAGSFEVLGDISRINRYGNTSNCITDDFNLRKFCYCKTNLLR